MGEEEVQMDKKDKYVKDMVEKVLYEAQDAQVVRLEQYIELVENGMVIRVDSIYVGTSDGSYVGQEVARERYEYAQALVRGERLSLSPTNFSPVGDSPTKSIRVMVRYVAEQGMVENPCEMWLRGEEIEIRQDNYDWLVNWHEEHSTLIPVIG